MTALGYYRLNGQYRFSNTHSRDSVSVSETAILYATLSVTALCLDQFDDHLERGAGCCLEALADVIGEVVGKFCPGRRSTRTVATGCWPV